ncbi:hypothetical protein BJ875DRAFT_186148 [Amylocarpus encephaloides]|uniref:Uncharacterized protein n=1 Tax=Amylocarpus encephaloides TaxID=45428 RepID=A0A9P8C181_9HELO|nr:hypothetical protein BJ875DRAFT_186148 [Amylocarpus encephaloides]
MKTQTLPPFFLNFPSLRPPRFLFEDIGISLSLAPPWGPIVDGKWNINPDHESGRAGCAWSRGRCGSQGGVGRRRMISADIPDQATSQDSESPCPSAWLAADGAALTGQRVFFDWTSLAWRIHREVPRRLENSVKSPRQFSSRAPPNMPIYSDLCQGPWYSTSIRLWVATDGVRTESSYCPGVLYIDRDSRALVIWEPLGTCFPAKRSEGFGVSSLVKIRKNASAARSHRRCDAVQRGLPLARFGQNLGKLLRTPYRHRSSETPDNSNLLAACRLNVVSHWHPHSQDAAVP